MATNVPTPFVNRAYDTLPIGAARLAGLVALMAEVRDKIAELIAFSIKGRSVDPQVGVFERMLDRLKAEEKELREQVDLSTGARLGWTQGFSMDSTRRSPGGGQY